MGEILQPYARLPCLMPRSMCVVPVVLGLFDVVSVVNI